MGPRFCKRGNHRHPRLRHRASHASMGPRFCKRGNGCSPHRSWAHSTALQWGHAFVSVETRQPERAQIAQLRASMGPRFCKRGNGFDFRRQIRHLVPASMGPRFCKRGNTSPAKLRPAPSTLQWGHAFVSVETAARHAHAPDFLDASMGPRFCKRGNSAA